MKDKIIGAAILAFTVGVLAGRFAPGFHGSHEIDEHEIAEAEHHHHHHHDEEEGERMEISSDEAGEMGIVIKEAGPGTLQFSLPVRGKIIQHPDRLVHILPKVPGIVKEALKNIGDYVHEGELIAILESTEMAEAKADLIKAIEKEELALSHFKREEYLRSKKITSEQDYLNAKAAFADSQLQVQLAKQKLYAYGQENFHSDLGMRFYEIRSPIDGEVTHRHLIKGEFVEGSSPIYEISDLSTVWIEIPVSPKDIGNVKKGQKVWVSSLEERVPATVIYVSPLIEEDTILSRAIASLENTDISWRPGTYVKVEIVTEAVEASVVVPKEAIQQIDGETCVFVRSHEGFEKRDVTVGRSDSNQIEIINGLEQGESYASSNSFLIKADIGKYTAEHEH